MKTSMPSTGGGIVVCRPRPLTFRAGQRQGFYCIGDIHLGAPHVDEALLKRELEEARQNGDRININGDLFDMILSRDAKRYTPSAIHPRLWGHDNMINEVVDMAFEIFGPYADLIDTIGVGNHETCVEKYHNVDPTGLLIGRLMDSDLVRGTPHVIQNGGYGGFIDYRFHHANKRANGATRLGMRYLIYRHHGAGGAAPTNKGIGDFDKTAAWVVSDVIWLAHKHHHYNDHVERLTCPLSGHDVVTHEVRYIMTGAYFNTYVGQSQTSIRRQGRKSNYAADARCRPQGKGGTRIELRFTDNDYDVRVTQ